MIAAKVTNQQHPPLPKRRRVDAKGNDKHRMFVKSGTATLLLCKGMSKNACSVLEQNISENIQRLGGELSCTFLIVK